MEMKRQFKEAVWSVLVLIIVIALTGCGNKNTPAEAAATHAPEKTADISAAPNPDKDKVVRIGYQKYGTVNFLKAQGKLDKILAEKGIKLEWTEFPGGPQLLEALNVGSIDFGHT